MVSQRYEQRAEREKQEAVAEAQAEAAKKFTRERLELFEKVCTSTALSTQSRAQTEPSA